MKLLEKVLILVLVEFLCKPNAVELARTAEALPKTGVANMVSENQKNYGTNYSIRVLILVLVEYGF